MAAPAEPASRKNLWLGGSLALPNPFGNSGSRLKPIRSACDVAAVHHEGRPSNVTPGLTGQKQGGADQLLRLAPAAQRSALAEDLFLCLREDGHRQIGQERARGDTV